MNILCLCSRGNNRSVALAHVLKDKFGKRDVLSAGLWNTSQETLVMLYEWADTIYIVEERMKELVHPEYQEKVKLVDIGIDQWGYSPHPGLMKVIIEKLVL